MATVIGVRFRNAGKLYYFDPMDLEPSAGDDVIVETARGQEFGEVVTGPQEVPDEEVLPPLRPVVRIASQEDAQHHRENVSREKEALRICKEKVAEHGLQMKLVSCEYTFDNSKLLFYFTADKRVDFRLLVKDLASVFHMRIELRQIGVRDEARIMGGLGICGRPLCCSRFLGDFHPVSIKMAKEQNLSLNPTKISGACGRLMCCLQYEEDFYEKARKAMPRVGRSVMTPDGEGVVTDVNLLRETVRVRMPKGNDDTELRDYPAADVQRLNGARPAVGRPEERTDELDEPDPEVMRALRASEMDVPDEDRDIPVPEDDEAPEQPRPVRRAERQPRPGRKPQGNGNQAAPREKREQERPPRTQQPRREHTNRPKPSAQAGQPAAKTQPKSQNDPWVVPEKYRTLNRPSDGDGQKKE